ncbi:hypothetical protein BJY04DRAFT_166963 [Aspergillus karnatakaensis]|uniref:uncharacterized protein n=1 Tax=Aspergillus karnatakaensis TaxID=1810916 RepID=UPI003CCDB19A
MTFRQAQEMKRVAGQQLSAVERSRERFRWSWLHFVRKGMKMIVRDLIHPSYKRTDGLVHIPADKMRRWKEEGRERSVGVTEHDILTAFIYQAAYQVDSEQDFSIVLSIRRQLQNQTAMHNAWILVPLTLAHLSHGTSETPSLLAIAAHVRHTIQEARKPETLSSLLDLHSPDTTAPMAPRRYGRKPPQVIVTSWTHLPLYDLNIRGMPPTFVYGELGLWTQLTKFGLAVDDTIITWRDGMGGDGEDAGYWVRGRFNEAVWGRMERTLEGSKQDIHS